MGIPTAEKMEIYPVAGHDCMELNLSGAHAPYFTRNIVILTDSNGVEGVGEVPGGEKITKALEDVKHLVLDRRLQADPEQGPCMAERQHQGRCPRPADLRPAHRRPCGHRH